jgi:competence protein ComEC
LIISLGLLPLTVHFFQQASVISPLANLIAVPVVGFVIVPVCFLGVVALFLIPSLGIQVLSFAVYVFELLLEMLTWFAELPFSHLTFATPGWLTLILAGAGFLLLLLPRILKTRILALLCIMPLLFPFHTLPEKGEAEVTVLDVGQGLAVVVQTAQHSMVYDAGPRFSQYFDTGRAVVIPYLNDKGIRQVDTLLISHGDNDHIGGAKSVLEALQIEVVVTSVPEKFSFSKTKRCQRGQTWSWDTVKIEVLHPDILDYVNGYSENNLSCVIKITTRSQSFLLTGDIEVEAETLLLERYADYLRSDTLIAPHHGSNSSSSSQFLAVVRPRRVIVPAGWRNRYRFPHGDVLERYARHSIEVLITAQQGAITMHSGSEKTSSFREQNRYYWERYNE